MDVSRDVLLEQSRDIPGSMLTETYKTWIDNTDDYTRTQHVGIQNTVQFRLLEIAHGRCWIITNDASAIQ